MTSTVTRQDERIAYCTAEAAHLLPPRTLPSLLCPGIRIAEVSSNYLPDLPTGEVSMDNSLPMVHVVSRSTEALAEGVNPFDIEISPNGALNMLSVDPDGLADAVRAFASMLAPEGRLLAQVMRIDLGHPCDSAPFYAPERKDDRWVEDRRFLVGDFELVRRQRQRRVRGRIQVDFTVHHGRDVVLEHNIKLRILTMREIRLAAEAAGLVVDHVILGWIRAYRAGVSTER
ncbi:hypothetical protein GCM10027290_67440 [Micromonospora sonneratiae]|uniref:Methyltransferase domain-containing protein n=1 Tax=Micromonospora sonneratiae TaxID=1184706 RepID=A0ABW3YQU0_9ACTN